MQVNFHPSVSFKSEAATPAVNSDDKFSQLEKRLTDIEAKINNPDTFIKPEAKQKKGFKGFIAAVAKAYTNTTEMVKGTFKGIVYGAMTGLGLLAGGWLLGPFANAFKKGNPFKETIKKPVGTKAKVVAGLGTAGVAVYHVVKARLKANQKTSNVDHQLRTGHRSK